MAKPEIFLISHSFFLGKFCEYSAMTPGSQLNYMQPNGWDIKPDAFDSGMANTCLPAWSPEAWSEYESLPTKYTKGTAWPLLDASTAKRFMMCNILGNDICTIGIGGETEYESIAALFAFHLAYIQDVLVTMKGATLPSIAICTGHPIAPATYGEVAAADTEYKAFTDGNCNHNIRRAWDNFIPSLNTLGVEVIDTWIDCMADFPSVAAFAGRYLDLDGQVHMSTARGSEWSARYLLPKMRAWLR